MLYKKMINKYGFLEYAERKYAKLLKNLIIYQSCSKRLKLFNVFMGIGVSYDGDLEFYMKAVYFLTKKW